MKLAVMLGGTDGGRSGLGTYVKEVVPALAALLRARGGQAIALGTSRDLEAYAPWLGDCRAVEIPSAVDGAGASALFHMLAADRVARGAGADVALFPAGNRRAPLAPSLPTVAVIHDLAQLHVTRKYDGLRMFYVRSVLTRAMRDASRLVAVSEATRRDLVEALGIPSDTVRVVPNGVDAGRFAPLEPTDPRVVEARRAHGLVRPYVLYVSRLEHPGKNHLRLLQAFAGSRARLTHDLVFAGGDWGARAAIEARVDGLGLRERVRLLGYVEADELPALVAGARSVAMVGLREGFGLPALEALSAGRPVLVSSTGALPEVVGPLGVVVDPHDVSALREGLDRTLEDTALRTLVAAEGPRWGAARGWADTAIGVLRACEEALAA